jgi:hypothetical protein
MQKACGEIAQRFTREPEVMRTGRKSESLSYIEDPTYLERPSVRELIPGSASFDFSDDFFFKHQ